MMFSRCSEAGGPGLVSDLGRKAFSLLPLDVMLATGFFFPPSFTCKEAVL